MTVNEMGLPWKNGENWEVQAMTCLVEAESKYGHVVRSAGGKVFGIETSTWSGTRSRS
jgi:hypothetical protein